MKKENKLEKIIVEVNTFLLWFIFKMTTGEENEQPRYKKRLINTLIAVASSTIVSIIINLILNYFK